MGIYSSAGVLSRKLSAIRKVVGNISFVGIVSGFKKIKEFLRFIVGTLALAPGTLRRKAVAKRYSFGSLSFAPWLRRRASYSRRTSGTLRLGYGVIMLIYKLIRRLRKKKLHIASRHNRPGIKYLGKW